jgi:hypothetical protein
VLLVCLLVCLIPAPAAAYIGPGAGLSAIGAFLSFVVAVFAAILGFIWYPIKRLIKRRKSRQSGSKAGPT